MWVCGVRLACGQNECVSRLVCGQNECVFRLVCGQNECVFRLVCRQSEFVLRLLCGQNEIGLWTKRVCLKTGLWAKRNLSVGKSNVSLDRSVGETGLVCGQIKCVFRLFCGENEIGMWTKQLCLSTGLWAKRDWSIGKTNVS